MNVAPGDWQHVQQTLPHQLRQLREQVDHVLITIDLSRPSGQYARPGYENDRDQLVSMLDRLRIADPNCDIRAVDPQPEMRATLGSRYCRGQIPPLRDAYGGPYHAYLQGIAEAPTDNVLHLDSDMLLGGGSGTWVREAMTVLDEHRELLLCSPLAGPPREDGVLPSLTVAAHAHAQRFGSPPQRVEGELAYRFRHASTRICLIRRDRLAAAGLKILKVRAGVLDHRVRQMAAPLEVALSALMQSHDLERLDMFGDPPGMWALHPHVRTPAFYAGLTELILRVEQGAVPDDQRGYVDLRRSMLDWGEDPARFDARPAWRREVSAFLRRTPLRSILERRARGFG